MLSMNQTSEKQKAYAVVTGGAAGLGRAFCQQLARAGCHLAIVDVDRSGADQTLQFVEQAGGTGQVEECDVTSLDAWHALRARLQADWPRLDLLINNAGMFSSGYVGRLDPQETERVVRLNLMSVVYGCDTMVPWLAETASSPAPRGRQGSPDRGSGRRLVPRPSIINVASVFAFYCPPEMAGYNLSKAGVIALSETLFTELREKGIGVTVVCPGPMPTRFVEHAYCDSPSMKRLIEMYLRKSSLTPERVAAAALRAIGRRWDLYCIVGTRERWYWRLKRLLPRTFLEAVAGRMRRDMKSLGSRAKSLETKAEGGGGGGKGDT